MSLPFEKIASHVFPINRCKEKGLAHSNVRLDYVDLDTGRRQKRWLEVSVSCNEKTPDFRLKRVSARKAWAALADFYDGRDPVDENLFLEDVITDAEKRQLYHDLREIELTANPEPLRGHLIRWLLPSDVPPEILERASVAA